MGSASSSSSGGGGASSVGGPSHEENLAYVRKQKFPINVFVSGPPNFNVSPLCSYLERQGPLVYVNHSGAESGGVVPVREEAAQTRIGQEQRAKEERCRELIEKNEERNRQQAGEAAASSNVVFDHFSRLLDNYALRHVARMPSTDMMTLPPDSSDANWTGLLWRLYRTSVIDVVYGFVPAAAQEGVLDERQRARLVEQGDVAFMATLNDCAPANSVFVLVLPTELAYQAVVDAALSKTTESSQRDLKARIMWQNFYQLQNVFEHGPFVKTYWTMVFHVDEAALSDASMACIGTQLLARIVALRQHKLWGKPWDRRRAYLDTQAAHTARFVHVPTFMRRPRHQHSALGRPAVNTDAFLADEYEDDDSGSGASDDVLRAASSSSTTVSRRYTDKTGAVRFERTTTFTLPSAPPARAQRRPSPAPSSPGRRSSTPNQLARTSSDTSLRRVAVAPVPNLASAAVLDVVHDSEAFHEVPLYDAPPPPARQRQTRTSGWEARGAKINY